jgi:hypothetical protein
MGRYYQCPVLPVKQPCPPTLGMEFFVTFNKYLARSPLTPIEKCEINFPTLLQKARFRQIV